MPYEILPKFKLSALVAITTSTPSAFRIICPPPKTEPAKSRVSEKLPKDVGLKLISTIALSFAAISMLSKELENGAFNPVRIAKF